MRNSTLFVSILAIFVSSSAQSIVIRHDVNDEKYKAKIDDFPPLATLYNIGVHGTLIAPNWVVTAAHTVFCMEEGDKIKVGEQWAEIESRYAHAEYVSDQENDIALLKLKQPIKNIQPAILYDKFDETTQNVWFIGSGASGNGKTGQTIFYSDNNGVLRKAENKIEKVSEREIYFEFNEGDKALPLEGVSGNADSGGPAFKVINNEYVLLGISSRSDSLFKGVGEYGVKEVYTRVSYHLPWLHQVMKGDKAFIRNNTTQHHFAEPNIATKLDQACNMIGLIG